MITTYLSRPQVYSVQDNSVLYSNLRLSFGKALKGRYLNLNGLIFVPLIFNSLNPAEGYFLLKDYSLLPDFIN